ncbi:hypothetical protein, partial [Rhizobium leguminosarum]|uniref:hypothetical protein n=1 Tax=Rhizobium leguminosarum TaxID=384 RepID=UPI003F97C4F2
RLFSFQRLPCDKCSAKIEKFSLFSTGTNHSTSHFPFELATVVKSLRVISNLPSFFSSDR